MGNKGCVSFPFLKNPNITHKAISNDKLEDVESNKESIKMISLHGELNNQIETFSTKEDDDIEVDSVPNIDSPDISRQFITDLFKISIQGDFQEFQNQIHSNLWKEGYLHLVQNFTWKSMIFPLTIFQISCLLGHVEIASYLLENFEIEVNLNETFYGNTALHLSVLNECYQIVELLLKDPFVDIKIKNFDGKTPLHIAIEKSNIGILECFFRLRQNIDLKIKDYEGNTLYHYCALYPNKDILKLLLLYANASESESQRVLTFSKRNSFFEVLNYQGETPYMMLQNMMQNNSKFSSDLLANKEDLRNAIIQCQEILKSLSNPTNIAVDTISSLGNHTREPSSDSNNGDDILTAFSWSPENERKSRRESISRLSFQID